MQPGNLQRIIWLASFPKSGNTWMRYLLAQYFMPKEKAPDINNIQEFTMADTRQDMFNIVAGRPWKGETFDDWVKMRGPVCRYIAQARPGTHFVKTHCQIQRIGAYDIIPPEVTAAAVYVMRNPFDVAPSFARHLGVDLDTAIDKMLDPKSLNVTPTLIFDLLGRWDEHISTWLSAPGLPRHVIRYEDMQAEPEKTFTELLNFLRAPVSHGRMRRALREASFKSMRKQEAQKGFRERPEQMERFFHSGKSGGWRETLTPAQVARLNDGFRPALERHYPEMLAEIEAAAAGA